MPKFNMCTSSKCPLKTTCKRHAASGTKPNKKYQAYVYTLGIGDNCRLYWEKKTTTEEYF